MAQSFYFYGVKFRFAFISLLFFSIAGLSQQTNNVRTKTIALADSIKLDSLSLIPNTLKISVGENTLDTSFYKVDYAKAIIYFDKNKRKELATSEIKTFYRVFNFDLSKTTQHKDEKVLKEAKVFSYNPFSSNPSAGQSDPFKMDGLNKTGSISRGIGLGNNQDVVVNSSFNLQLSGKLTNSIDILLSASDDNIPIQPDGNTQQLQEFDKVFIQLSDKNSKLIAGDFQMFRPNSYFMNFNKRAQGLSFSTAYKVNQSTKDTSKYGVMKTSLSGAVSKGKFARNVSLQNGTENTFNAQKQEKSQGPYRLRGAENEQFIIVLSGTEKVYLDGVLLDRGAENDYIIDYNTAELTFTPRNLITKDKRIIVEFQYSDKNYARSLAHFEQQYVDKKWNVRLNIYSEQDNKNKSLQQELTQEQKKLLSLIGDTLSSAVVPSFDSVTFNSTEVLYARIDTTVGTFTFPDIFLYSSVDTLAHFRATFSFVGAGKGNYNQISSSANGKVFQWVMPDTISGARRGSYEPVRQLITPKQKQMASLAIDYAVNQNTKIFVESAVSNNDINTFSKFDSQDDVGQAVKVGFENSTPLFSANDSTKQKTNSWRINSGANYEYVQKIFSPIERFRSTEFDRDWNRNSSIFNNDQHIASAQIGLSKKNLSEVQYRFNSFFEGNDYAATKHDAKGSFAKKGFFASANGSYLETNSITQNTSFLRHNATISQKIKKVTIGVREAQELNLFKIKGADSLLNNSYQFLEWEAFSKISADSTGNKIEATYKQRTDYGTRFNNLSSSAFAQNMGLSFELTSNPNSQLRATASYRKLEILDTLLIAQKPENTVIGRIEYNAVIFGGAIISGTFYEVGSGLEQKREFSFIEVAAGQGTHTYIGDVNENGVKDIDEFEIAVFQDQAKYIKVFIPSDKYISTYTNQFSQSLILKPAAVWKNKTGAKKIISYFSNQVSYQVDRKTTDDDLSRAYNPFLQKINDTLLVALNSSFRNTFFFNQSGAVFSADVSYQDSRNKALLTNGIDSRANTFKEGRTRWNMTKKFSLSARYKEGNKVSASEYFTSRDYFIKYFETEPQFSFQPSTAFRASASYKYVEKNNKIEGGGQKAVFQNSGAELRYNVLTKGSISVKANYIFITYSDFDNQNTQLAFEMLEGLKAGQNYTWSVSFLRTLANNIQLNFQYDGRKSENNKVIHTGTAQVRAYF